MSWYRKHRPRQVKDLNLTTVRETLLQFMKKGKIPQVLLFAGPKGTGKTSSARIIGAMLNEAQNEALIDYAFFGKKKPAKSQLHEPDASNQDLEKIFDGQSYVVQEMDAASHRGIDDIRALKERVSLPPQQGKMTVYILDEAHMLTTEAFNALLKLLEEPPPHVVFILATTELHKLPETVTSRSSLVNFQQASLEEIKQALEVILTREKLKYDDEALDLITQRANGSFRDAVKLLEMASDGKKVALKQVEQLVSGSTTQEICNLLDATLAKDEAQVSQIFQELRANNINEQFFFNQLIEFLHLCLLQNLGVKEGSPYLKQKVAQFLLAHLSTVDLTINSPIGHLALELKILELIGRAKESRNGGSQTAKKKSSKTKSQKIIEEKLESEAQPVVDSKQSDTPKQKTKTTLSSADHNGDSKKLLAKWSDFLAAVKQKNITLEALLRSAKPLSGLNGTAQVAVYYNFHKEQLESPKFRQIIGDCSEPLAGGKVKIDYVLSEPPHEAELVEKKESDDLAVLAEEVLI